MNEREEEPATDTTLEPQINEDRATEAKEPEPTPIIYDILIFCHRRNVSTLVNAFEVEIKDAAGELPLSVLWSGISGVLHQGVIVLKWQGELTPHFLHNLSIDQEIFDYIIYDHRWRERGDQGKGSEPKGLDDQSGDNRQIEEEQLL